MLGCNSSSGEATQAADAGAEDASAEDAPVMPDPLVDKLCPGACAAAAECDERVEVTDCLEQCAKEIVGEGYLIPEVATQLFEFINEDVNDDNLRCQRMRYWGYWMLDPWSGDGVEITMDDPAAIEPCVERYSFCMGQQNVENNCWAIYYRYNHPYRASILECLQAPCSATWSECVYNQVPKGQPWLAIPEQKSVWD